MRTWMLVSLIMVSVVGCAHGPKEIKVLPPPKHAPLPPPRQPMALSPALRQQAQTQIETSLNSDDEVIRSNAIEAAQKGVGTAARKLILSKLTDPSPLVRFAACMATGELRLTEAHQQLLGMVHDPSYDVQLGSRFALHRIGDFTYSHDFEKYARNLDPRVRGNTAMVLGLLGEKSALKVLRGMRTDAKPGVRLQVSEAMWRLGDESALDALVAATISAYADDQIIGVLALAGPRDTRVAEHIRGKLVSDFPEVSLAAARALGELGMDDGYVVAQKGADSVDPRQRALAALAFGAIGRSDAQPILQKLLAAPEEPVRLAAATAILELKPG